MLLCGVVCVVCLVWFGLVCFVLVLVCWLMLVGVFCVFVLIRIGPICVGAVYPAVVRFGLVWPCVGLFWLASFCVFRVVFGVDVFVLFLCSGLA